MNLSFDGKESTIQPKQLKSLYDIAGLISAKLSLEEILDAIPPAIKTITGSDQIMLALAEKTPDGVKIDRDTIKHTCPHPSHLLQGNDRWRVAFTVIETNKPILVLASGKSISRNLFSEFVSEEIVFAIIPLSAQNKSIGFLSALAPKNCRFAQADIVLLTILASQIAIAIENLRLHGLMHELTLAKERNRIAKEILAIIMKADKDKPTLTALDDYAHEELTDKELQILALIARGYTNEEIASELWIGLRTVKTHVSSILKKLGQKNRVQAITFALRSGLVKFELD